MKTIIMANIHGMVRLLNEDINKGAGDMIIIYHIQELIKEYNEFNRLCNKRYYALKRYFEENE